VTFQGNLVALKGLGRFTYDDSSQRVSPETIYDLASVTKVVATTAACMLLYEGGIFRLEQKLITPMPEFAGADPRRAGVTLGMLLDHTSGLPAHARLYETAHNKEELLQQAASLPLTADPGVRAEYSDIGFILLGAILERFLSEPLDRFCQREIFSPLRLQSMTFNPSPELRTLIPPTVNDQAFRQRIIQGEVNDENAFAMGGVAGQAGCFATAHDVALFAECMLRGGAPLLRPSTVELFTRRQPSPAGTSRALGWDTPSSPSQAGKHFSSKAYGHLGYTGTSLWVDPERRLSVTLLTNHTWPDGASQLIKQVRPAFHDAVVEALS
jgi:CubicO group peptidase (beta-lactamase class C family)